MHIKKECKNYDLKNIFIIVYKEVFYKKTFFEEIKKNKI